MRTVDLDFVDIMDFMRVAIVDDDALARAAMGALLQRAEGITISWMASSGLEALARVEDVESPLPEVFLVDIGMPKMDGIELVRRLRALTVPPVVIIVSALATADKIRAAFRAGATGYFVKEDDPALIAQSIPKAASGELVFSPTCSRQLIAVLTDDAAVLAIKHNDGGSQDSILTERERQVLVLMSESRTNSQIARQLRISENTVKTHIKAIMQKFHTTDRAGAVAYGIRQGIID